MTAVGPAARRGGRGAAVLRLQRAAGNRAVARTIVATSAQRDGSARALARKTVASVDAATQVQDWTDDDRINNTPRWQAACLANLKAGDSSQYRRIVERRDFYRWFYHYINALGYETRWPLAASIVADGIHHLADIEQEHPVGNAALGLSELEVRSFAREGNQVIFDDVLPKLKALSEGPVLKGADALHWDMQTLAEEQTLVQPMYARMSEEAYRDLDYIARKRRFVWLGAKFGSDDDVTGDDITNSGVVPAFDGEALGFIGDRWRYGMELGNTFTPNGTGFDPTRDVMPAVGAAYSTGSELARLDQRRGLHLIDTYLSSSAYERPEGLVTALTQLSEPEKHELLRDSTPDGGTYSAGLAWRSITAAEVMLALPTDAGSIEAVAAFLTRFNAQAAQRHRVDAAYESDRQRTGPGAF